MRKDGSGVSVIAGVPGEERSADWLPAASKQVAQGRFRFLGHVDTVEPKKVARSAMPPMFSV